MAKFYVYRDEDGDFYLDECIDSLWADIKATGEAEDYQADIMEVEYTTNRTIKYHPPKVTVEPLKKKATVKTPKPVRVRPRF